MRRRHPLPRTWLFTDERMGEMLWEAVARLPRGSGVVFRDYRLPEALRRAKFTKLTVAARARGLIMVRAGPDRFRGEQGVHGRRAPSRHELATAPAHSRREAIAAIRRGAELLFVSPVFATRSHPGARTLGRVRLGLLIRGLPVPVIALGGMDARRFASLRPLGVHGWAGIDAWLKPQR